MAGILERFKDIMSANINALLDKAEDPSLMVDQYLKNMENDLANVKAETAAVMAEESRTNRELIQCQEEIDKMTEYAKKAVQAGNEDDARLFLEKKNALLIKKENLEKIYLVASENASKMRGMYEKLLNDIAGLQEKKHEIKAKIAVAKTQNNINNAGNSVNSAGGTMAAFEKMSEKADRMLDEANAMTQLTEQKADSDLSMLKEKYDGKPKSDAVEAELAAMKAELNKK